MSSRVATGTFIDFAETSRDELARWLHTILGNVLDALAPDGRGYDMVKLTAREEAVLYARDLHGNPEGWGNWIDERVKKLVDRLKAAGIDEATIASIHPYNLVVSAALVYETKMQRFFARESEKARVALRPSTPQITEGVTADGFGIE